MPEILLGYGQHQARAGQVGRADDVAAVRGDLDPVPGHDRDDFRLRRVSRIIPAERTGQSRCARTAGKGWMSFMSLIAILPVNSFRPFPMKIVGCRGFPGCAALEKCAQ